jgi:ABC-type antimicrobial peptide transport system permease subunit
VRLVLRQILAMLVLGSTAGVIATFITTRLLRAAMPPSTTGNDPGVIASAVVLLAVASVLAALGPAMGAARIDPAVALHAE